MSVRTIKPTADALDVKCPWQVLWLPSGKSMIEWSYRRDSVSRQSPKPTKLNVMGCVGDTVGAGVVGDWVGAVVGDTVGAPVGAVVGELVALYA